MVFIQRLVWQLVYKLHQGNTFTIKHSNPSPSFSSSSSYSTTSAVAAAAAPIVVGSPYSANSGLKSDLLGASRGCNWAKYVIAHIK